MFKRRRAAAATGGSDLPFCTMCGQTIRMDATTGRCALGHRVATVPVAVAATTPVAAEVTPLVAAAEAGEAFGDPYADTIVWEPSTPVASSGPASNNDALDEFIAWEQPGGGSFSALEDDTRELPVAEETGFLAGEPEEDRGSSLLDELDDATHARRQAVGTIGATIGISGMVFVAIAALPF